MPVEHFVSVDDSLINIEVLVADARQVMGMGVAVDPVEGAGIVVTAQFDGKLRTIFVPFTLLARFMSIYEVLSGATTG